MDEKHAVALIWPLVLQILFSGWFKENLEISAMEYEYPVSAVGSPALVGVCGRPKGGDTDVRTLAIAAQIQGG